jgi:uncharacterized protein (DUF983 family)
MSIITNTISGKCPCCQQSPVFETSKGASIFSIPKMRDKCNNCGFRFSKEPGFFFGAMYVSYGLAVAQMLTTAVIARFILGTDNLTTFIAMAVVTLLLSKVNYKTSRLIWIQLFMKKAACPK